MVSRGNDKKSHGYKKDIENHVWEKEKHIIGFCNPYFFEL